MKIAAMIPTIIALTSTELHKEMLDEAFKKVFHHPQRGGSWEDYLFYRILELQGGDFVF